MKRDMKKVITVTVTGQNGVGKSAVMQKLGQCMDELGFPVTVSDLNLRSDERLYAALASIQEHGVEIDLIEQLQKRII